MIDEEIPLPPEPDDEFDDDQPWEPAGPAEPTGSPLAILDAIRRDREAAEARLDEVRPRHIATGVGRLDDVSQPHPRGLHVPCPACHRGEGLACEHPTRPSTPTGFVHPSRLDAEREWWRSLPTTPLAG